jgi:glycosyltransferase involved in cell wall biosynthesis
MGMDQDLATIVITPVRNEAAMLDRFLRCVSSVADLIVIVDHGSSDGSREIAAKHPKVRLIDYTAPEFDETARRRLLLEAAREVPGKRFILALDADEVLTATWVNSAAWRKIRDTQPGTAVYMRWLNLLPGGPRCWVPPGEIAFGYVDDGAPLAGGQIHFGRLPVNHATPGISIGDVGVLHYQYLDWRRMKSKQRWYQCWELLNVPGKRPIQVYRQYHQMDAIPSDDIVPVERDWLAMYERDGIDMTAGSEEPFYWWDREVLRWLKEYGTNRFRKLDIWDVDWEEAARFFGEPVVAGTLADPRGRVVRGLHHWLEKTQRRAELNRVRAIQRALIPLGW